MITGAKRTNKVQEYYFSQKLKAIEKMNCDGQKVINLGIGNPDLLPPREAVQELVNHMTIPNSHGYQSYKGIPSLRQGFADWYEKFFKVQIDPEKEILPLMGSKEGIMHISLAFLDEGDQVLIPNPGYPTYASVTKMLGAEAIEYRLKEENQWLPDFESLEKLNLDKVKIMWVNYPNMPTGKNACLELFQQLVDFGRKHQILIVNDNPYAFILNENPLSIFSIANAGEVCLELNSLSKSHNMAGFRVGMVAGSEEHINLILKMKSNMDSGMYKPLQLAAVKALNKAEDWYRSINEEYAKRRVVVHELFELLGAQFEKDQVGLFVWARIPEGFEDAYEFSDLILNEARVFITPGGIFGSEGENYCRISLCSPVNTLENAIKRIEESHVFVKL
ncbi:MAG: aminotransferase class I/II-fold pyridoxal phosphate-dependent enzyme [Crocinitomicaceae bacterium]|nr:aminotransferase class I/II-fold pyridoxal phosphate-dependent enzyme [Crocinitomicaceae bacterium]